MSYRSTRRACFTGYITQAIINNLAPLLFIVFQTRYHLPLENLGRLVLLNFGAQMATDLAAVHFIDRIGYRRPMVAAHILCTAGLLLLAVAPMVAPSPYLGLCVAVVVYAIGGGLLEVMVSPIVDALPSPAEHKASEMALLHSFYCWGQVGVVAGSTLVLAAIGQGAWYWLPAFWAIVPFVNTFAFLRVPLPETVPDTHRMSMRDLFRSPFFGLAMVLMLLAGSSELTMAQWSSFFAEQGLGLSKVWGDLAGPCLFAILMGLGRMAYGLWGSKIPLVPAIAVSGGLTVVCYLTAALSPDPRVALAGCAVCGVGICLLWPGTFSLAAARFPMGGAAMFGLLAVMGDAGAAVGPWAAGWIGDVSQAAGGPGLKAGILAGTAWPLALVATILLYAVLVRRAQTPVLDGE